MSKNKSNYNSKENPKKKKIAVNKKQLWISKNYSKINKFLLGIVAVNLIIITILWSIHLYYISSVISYISILLIIIDILLYFYSTKNISFDTFITIITLLGIFSFLFAPSLINAVLNLIEEIPEVELSVTTPLDPVDPMEYPFIIKNVGQTDILNLNIDEKHFIKGNRNTRAESNFQSLYLQTKRLRPNEKTTFVLGHTIKLYGGNIVESITVEFIVTYKTISVKRIERHFKYVGVRMKNGEYNWYPKSMTED